MQKADDFADVLKTRTDSLDLSTRTLNALTGANIRTLGGLARKKREDLLEVEGIGEKGITEIKKVLNKFGSEFERIIFMRHHNNTRKFGRDKTQKRALLNSLALNLIVREKIKTTEPKAKELRPFIEKLVTRAKANIWRVADNCF